MSPPFHYWSSHNNYDRLLFQLFVKIACNAIEAMAEGYLHLHDIEHSLFHWRYQSQQHLSVLVYERLAECYLLIGSLSTATTTLSMACEMKGDESMLAQIKETAAAIQDCTDLKTTAEQWIHSQRFDLAIPILKRWREYTPLWRMPFILLLRCYVKLELDEDAWKLVQSIDWVNRLGKGENPKSDLSTGLYEEGCIRKGFDETFVGTETKMI